MIGDCDTLGSIPGERIEVRFTALKFPERRSRVYRREFY